VQLVLLQALLQEPVTGDVLQLLQSVDLRQLVLQREPILGVYVRNEFSQRSLRLEDQGLPEVGHLQLLELLQAGQGVRAEPRPQRRDPAIVLGKTGLVAGLGRDATYLRGELAVLQLVQEIDGLAVAVAADDDVADVVDHAAQLQGRGLVGGQLVEEVLRMGDDVARVSHWNTQFSSVTESRRSWIRDRIELRRDLRRSRHARTRAVIITDEHVAHVGLREPRGDHPAVDAGEEHGFRLKLINRRTVGEPALSQNNSLYNLELLTVGLSFTCTNCFTICSFFTLLYLIIPRRMRSMLTMSNKLPVLPSLGRTQRSR
jgi:hypothetical protein